MRASWFTPLLFTGCGLFGDSPLNESLAWDTAGADVGFWATPSAVEHRSRTHTWRSATFAEPTGVAPMREGDDVWTGMASMVCRVSFMNGTVGTDVDPEVDEIETVVDHNDHEVLSITPSGFQILVPEQELFQIEEHEDVIDARLRPHGTIWLQRLADGCRVMDGDTELAQLPTPACSGGGAFSVDPGNGTIWIAADDQVIRKIIPGSAPTESPLKGDLVTTDSERHIVYTASREDSAVTAAQPDGTVLWTADLGGQLRNMRALSHRGVLAALISRGNDSVVLFLSAETGSSTEVFASKTRVVSVHASTDGRRLGVVTRGQVDFLEETP